MDNHKNTFWEFGKGRAYSRLAYIGLVLFPLIIIIFCIEKKVFLLILVIFLLIYYISVISLAIYCKRYLDKKESLKRLELREMEEKIFRKNLRK